MQGKTHMLIGAAFGLSLSVVTAAPLEAAIAFALLGAAGGLVPDIDHPNSSISHRLPILRLLTFWIPHRTVTHSWIALLLTGAAAVLLGNFAHAFALGYWSHIAGDMLTRQGIPLLYPLRYRFYLLPRFARLTTGGIIESGLTLTMFLVCGLLIWKIISPLLTGVYAQTINGMLF